MERTNFRLLPDDAFPGGFDVIVVDASFISVRTIARASARVSARPGGAIVALVKPQFEAGRERVGGGRRRAGRRRSSRAVLREVRDALPRSASFRSRWSHRRCAVRPGNREFFMRVARRRFGRSTTHESRRSFRRTAEDVMPAPSTT